jgi:hypothetical protein
MAENQEASEIELSNCNACLSTFTGNLASFFYPKKVTEFKRSRFRKENGVKE